MSNQPLPTIPATGTPAVPPSVLRVDAAPASTWDRLSSWISENKAVVYTIAGVAVVVTGAGAVYYLNSSSVSKLRLVHLFIFVPSRWVDMTSIVAAAMNNGRIG